MAVCLSLSWMQTDSPHAHTHRYRLEVMERKLISRVWSGEATPMGLIKEMEQTAEIIGEHNSFSNTVSRSLFCTQFNESNMMKRHKIQFFTGIQNVLWKLVTAFEGAAESTSHNHTWMGVTRSFLRQCSETGSQKSQTLCLSVQKSVCLFICVYFCMYALKSESPLAVELDSDEESGSLDAIDQNPLVPEETPTHTHTHMHDYMTVSPPFLPLFPSSYLKTFLTSHAHSFCGRRTNNRP